jgi:hypothetical protein
MTTVHIQRSSGGPVFIETERLMVEASHGFWSYLHRRIIAISTMERDVRLAFIGGSAMVVVAIALNILGEHLGPSIDTLIGRLPLSIVVALAIGELAVFFLICMALFGLRGRWFYGAHAFVIASFALFVWMNNADPLTFTLLMPMAILWAISFLGRRQVWRQRDYVLGALLVSFAAMLVFVLYLATGREVLIISALAWQGLVAMLGLCMAATDIAELISVATESASAKLARFGGGAWPALVVALIAIFGALQFTLTASHSQWTSRTLAQMLGAGTGLSLWLGLICWMALARRKKVGAVHLHIDYWALLLIVGFYFVAFQAGIGRRILSDPASYRASQIFNYPEVFLYTTLGALGFIIALFAVGQRTEKLLVQLAYGSAIGMFFFHYYSSHGENIVLIVDAVAIGSLLFLGFSRLSRKMRANYASVVWIIADLNVAMLGYFALATLFLSLSGHGHEEAFGLPQALIILVALAWDLVSSGESITNRHSYAFPRLARVALFIAYVTSVALLVMVATAGRFVHPLSGETIANIFNSEGLVGVGLVMFGAPLIFIMAMLRLRNVLAEADGQAAPASRTLAQSAASSETVTKARSA